MRVDKELPEHVATIARLKLKEKEIKEFTPELKEILEAFSKLDKIDTKGIIVDKNRPTIQKVRVMGHNQQLLRIDYEKREYTSRKIEYIIIKYVKKVIDYIEGDSIPFENDPVRKLAKEGQLMARQHNGFWQPIKYPWHAYPAALHFFEISPKFISDEAVISERAVINSCIASA